MFNLILGIVIGAVFSPLLIKLFKILWGKLEKSINKLKK